MSEPTVETMLALYETMIRIRRLEDRVHELFADGELPGFLHLCAGQEAVAAGVASHLRVSDVITSTHRNHGHALAKGVDMTAMMTELYGRAGGTNAGKGGSMHIADASVGHLASGGIVGASGPLALGPALAAVLDGRDDLAVAFFGDGGAQQGTVLESMNLAASWRLPVVFVCENNMFAQATLLTYASAASPALRAEGFGIPSEQVDGQDVLAVYGAAERAVSRARAGGGPTYIECRTYSYYGAWEGEPKRSYRLPEVESDYRTRDPLTNLAAVIGDRLPDWAARRVEIDERALDEVDEAVEAARAAPDVETSSGDKDVYADPLAIVDRNGLSVY